ncbi:MAG: glycosyltransferase family 39 protein [Candidatus Daviesbacteria bacterium]
MNIKNRKIVFTIFIVVIILASVLRFYKLDQVPPSLSWDEAAVGYNAYTIANWGKDEWGRVFPAYFTSFEDDKNPVHIYLTALSAKFLGSSDFSTRFPMALLGILSVIVIYFLAKILFKSNIAALFASLIFAISPYTLQFSRFNHEAIVTIFFFMLGLLMFFLALEKNPKLLLFSFLSFGIDIITYHPAKIVVPIMLLLLSIFFFKDLLKIKVYFLISLVILALILCIIWFNPPLLGQARMQQSSLPEAVIKNTKLYEQTQNELLGRIEISLQRYLTYFSPDYLFKSGDAIARHSSQAVGEFYKIDGIFLVIGLLGLLLQRSKKTFILLVWVLIAPIPASISGGLSETGHAARALFMMGSWHLVAALGYSTFLKLFKKSVLQITLAVILLAVLGWEMKLYLDNYYGEYIKKYAIEWQYGMKQIVDYVKDKNGYSRVYMTDIRSQPYIFFLYYLKTPLPEYLETVSFNTSQSRSSNLVASFGRYQFAYWDPIESSPVPLVLYIVGPNHYDGLRARDLFDIKKRILFPNGNDAFFIVGYP